MVPCAIGVSQAIVEGVFGCQERNHALSRCVVPEIGNQMSQVVFFLLSDGAVRQEDVGVVPG